MAAVDELNRTAFDLFDRYCTSDYLKGPFCKNVIHAELHFKVGEATCFLGSSHLTTAKRVWSVNVPMKDRGKGNGRRLMGVITMFADEVGRDLDLFVLVDNRRAIHLYQKFGFTITNTIPADTFRRDPLHYMFREHR